MSSIETPPTVACSFSEGTPHLTINREATIDLDSSTAFEGKFYSVPISSFFPSACIDL